jgi:uncharacterized protein (DUF362 family)
MPKVAIGSTVPQYCETPPFHPDEPYLELGFPERSATPNPPYRLLRRLLADLGCDPENQGKPEWNPLRHWIEPGQTVLIKPNFVMHRNGGGGDLFAVVTHPSIIRTLVDYAFLALRGEGRIVIADAPMMHCDWEVLQSRQRIDTIQAFYRERFGFDVELIDLRPFFLRDPDQPPYADNRVPLAGDPLGGAVIQMGRQSHFYGLPSENYYGADVDVEETRRHHHGEVHDYCVSRTVLSADTILSVPKLKTHTKVGVTLNLKGLVGINTNKNYLIHYRVGAPSEGGDQLPDWAGGRDRFVFRAQQWLYRHLLTRRSAWGDRLYRSMLQTYQTLVAPMRSMGRGREVPHGGSWHGNDSAWRMTADLVKVLNFADAEGVLRDEPQRKLFCVIDGIVAGEGNGPLSPSARRPGCLVAGSNPIATDVVASRIMGFDPGKVRQFSVLSDERWDFGFRSPSEIEVVLDGRTFGGEAFFDPSWRDPIYSFELEPAWKGHLEV